MARFVLAQGFVRLPLLAWPGLRRFLSKEIPACGSVRPPSVFRQPLQSSLCAGWRAWKANEPPAHSGISVTAQVLPERFDRLGLNGV